MQSFQPLLVELGEGHLRAGRVALHQGGDGLAAQVVLRGQDDHRRERVLVQQVQCIGEAGMGAELGQRRLTRDVPGVVHLRVRFQGGGQRRTLGGADGIFKVERHLHRALPGTADLACIAHQHVQGRRQRQR